MKKLFHPLYAYPLAALEFFKASAQCFRLLSLDHLPRAGDRIDDNFFGVNVAPGDDPATDCYILERLHQLGVRQVRMDFSYDSWESPAERLLQHLLDADIDVMLDLLPPRAEAELLYDDVEAQQRWITFLQRVFAVYSDRVSCFEIGNTPNRGRWSGFSSRSFLMAGYLASTEANSRGIRLAGPNVSDFEPLFNATYLRLLKRLGAAPTVHTDNLFVERVVEPEAYDHRVLGWVARGPLKLNLVKKARILQALGAESGCTEFMCTYTCWTLKRLSRRSAWPEQKRVDYLVRYLALAAASGALSRVYWGPLICSRDGLIDDDANGYPLVDQVSFYQKVRGSAASFYPVPAFDALGYVVRQLAGADCVAVAQEEDGLSLFAYRTKDHRHLLLAWCCDAATRPLTQVLSEEDRQQARYFSACGDALPEPVVINENPLFIELDSPAVTALKPHECKFLHSEKIRSIVHLSSPRWQSVAFAEESRVGARMLRADRQQFDLSRADELLPEAVSRLEELEVLRDVRNRLWNVRDPRGICDRVTVKLNRVGGARRISYRFRPSKGRRHWNNACHMLRRGVDTPLPIAFYESPDRPGIRDSWYLCEFIPDAFSARDIYAAFRQGDSQYRGRDQDFWYDLIAGFVCRMHDKQIVHRDLSAGNLLIRTRPDGRFQPMVIDIGRAWVWPGPGSKVRHRHRMLDLIRIAYKLSWADRSRFVVYYEAHLGRALSPLWRIPFMYYDSKQALKKSLKKRKKRGRRHRD